MLSVVLNPNLEDYPAIFFLSLLFYEELLRIKFTLRNTLQPLHPTVSWTRMFHM